VPPLPQWPLQLAQVSPDGLLPQDARWLVVAHCVPFALPRLHDLYLQDRAVLLCCPMAGDTVEQSRRLRAILLATPVRDLTVLKLWAPCCRGLEYAGLVAAEGLAFPVEVHTVSRVGEVTRVVSRPP
jgi:hypothetical protein